jgi:hypothetical protein
MSDYGADQNPDIPKARQLAFGDGFIPLDGVNVMQWTYTDGNPRVVRKLAKGGKHSNILFLMSE